MPMMSIAILNINGVDYRSIIFGISKSAAIDVFKNFDFSEKKTESLKDIKNLFFFLFIKMSNENT